MTVIRDPDDWMGAKVNSEGKLRTYSVVEPEFAYFSEHDGNAYSWTAVSANIDTGDTMLYVVNNSTTLRLSIKKIYVWADVVVQFKIHCPAYVTPAGGSVVVGVNLNRQSGAAADATARADETSNVFTAANVITTLRNTHYVRGNGDDLVDIAAPGRGQWVDYEGALILGYHNSVAVDIIGESVAFECAVMGYFHD